MPLPSPLGCLCIESVRLLARERMGLKVEFLYTPVDVREGCNVVCHSIDNECAGAGGRGLPSGAVWTSRSEFEHGRREQTSSAGAATSRSAGLP